MSQDPPRLLDGEAEELEELRAALRQARARPVNEPTIEGLAARLRVNIERMPATHDPEPDIELAPNSEVDPDSPFHDPNDIAPISVTTEQIQLNEAPLSGLETESGGGLTASLLAAGAMVLLRHRKASPTRADDEEE